MKLVLATSNKGKVREIQMMCKEHDVIPYSDFIDPFEIIEDAPTFKGNALLKAHAVYKALNEDDIIVIADDSGISIDALDGAPGIYSARFAGEDASDKDNLNKVIESLHVKNLKSSPAHYTAAIAIVGKEIEFSVHGWMYGDVISAARGDHGFGYDPIFIPMGFDKTLGELDDEVKKELSHRSQALDLVKVILQTL